LCVGGWGVCGKVTFFTLCSFTLLPFILAAQRPEKIMKISAVLPRGNHAGSGWTGRSARVLRGASWNNNNRNLLSSNKGVAAGVTRLKLKGRLRWGWRRWP
jgi:hypothetical protein